MRFQMSLRWTSYVAPKPPKRLKNAERPFSIHNRTFSEESLQQSSKTVRDIVVGHSLAYLSV